MVKEQERKVGKKEGQKGRPDKQGPRSPASLTESREEFVKKLLSDNAQWLRTPSIHQLLDWT